ncbi:N-6 DNA methylase [Candidatus Electronema sp. TJ]|uniref:N-6 DNA methylase n=1 Tax=Candidatus Electronema sp. TJ TaxID=3401573 RepID=UPI003AA8004F
MLFNLKPNDSICIDAAAAELRVSVATVRNWIKTGYLEKDKKNSISIDSFEKFKKNVIGAEKLNKRANKSVKDSHNHSAVEKYINTILDEECIDIEEVGSIYERKLSESYKNIEGIFYTPANIVNEFFKHLPADRSEIIFCDPCCGTGNFLVAAARYGFKQENIYGFDIDGIAVKIARKRLAVYFNKNLSNIFQENIFDKNISDNFDVVFTNPPWGKKISREEKKKLSLKFKCENINDTSELFFYLCLNILKKNGALGLLLQDAFFNVSVFENARKKALSYKIRSIIDFGKPFCGLVTKAKGMILEKNAVDEKNIVCCFAKNESHLRVQHSFTKNSKSILNTSCTEEDNEVLKHLFNIKHITLKGNAHYGIGIVTGNNKKYCSGEAREGYIPAYKGSDITKNGLKEPSTFIPNNFSLYQQVAPLDFYFSNEKLIYKFISSELVFFHDTEQRIILNSANMLILDKKFPITHKQLCDLLNSKIMSWIFFKLFETNKVLRSDIEYLPIFTDYFYAYSDFEESFFLEYLNIKDIDNGTYTIKK